MSADPDDPTEQIEYTENDSDEDVRDLLKYFKHRKKIDR
jgi:hypothetical protein